MTRLDRHLRVVEEIAAAAEETQEVDELLRRVCASVARGFGFERVVVAAYDAEREEVHHLVAYGIEDHVLHGLPTPLAAHPLVRQAFETREVVFVEQVRPGVDVDGVVVEELGITSALAVPLFAGKRWLGYIGGDRAGRPFRLDEPSRRMLRAAAEVAAPLLERVLADGPRRMARG